MLSDPAHPSGAVPPGGLQEQTGALRAAARPVAKRAERLSRSVLGLALASLGAAGWVWSVGFYPLRFAQPGSVLLAGGALLGLLVPPGVLALFYLALQEAARLPQRIARVAGEGPERVVSYYQAAGWARERGWLGQVLRDLFDLRGVMIEHREVLAGHVALARLASPLVLALLCFALVAALLLVAAGVVTVPAVLLA